MRVFPSWGHLRKLGEHFSYAQSADLLINTRNFLHIWDKESFYHHSKHPGKHLRIFQTSARKPRNQCKHQQLCVNFLSRWQFCCAFGLKSASPKYAHWTALYLSFHLSWVLGLFVHGRLQNLKTSRHFWPWLNHFNRVI